MSEHNNITRNFKTEQSFNFQIFQRAAKSEYSANASASSSAIDKTTAFNIIVLVALEGLYGHICRCTGYVHIVRAIRAAARMLAEDAKNGG